MNVSLYDYNSESKYYLSEDMEEGEGEDEIFTGDIFAGIK